MRKAKETAQRFKNEIASLKEDVSQLMKKVKSQGVQDLAESSFELNRSIDHIDLQ